MQPEDRKKLTFLTFFTAEIVLSLLAFLAGFSIFFYLTYRVFYEKNLQVDHQILKWIAKHHSEFQTQVLRFITFFASKNFLVTVPTALTVFFLFFRKWRWFSAYIFVATLGAFLLNQYLKNNFVRPRPDTALFFQSGFSFPSGHAMIGTAFYGALAYLIWIRVKNKNLKLILVGLLVIWELLIAYSRVYLNVHYPTDVVAGLAAGLFWLALSVFLLRQLQLFVFYTAKRRRKKLRNKPGL